MCTPKDDVYSTSKGETSLVPAKLKTSTDLAILSHSTAGRSRSGIRWRDLVSRSCLTRLRYAVAPVLDGGTSSRGHVSLDCGTQSLRYSMEGPRLEVLSH